MSSPPRRGADKKAETPTRRRDAQENYERIVKVASEVFATRGLSATLADVAAAAGVGIGTVYRCFANKDDLVLELFGQKFAAVERLALVASQAEDPWDGFVRYFEETTRQLAADRGLRQFVLDAYTERPGWARGTAPDRITALMQRTEAAVRGHMATLVRRAKKAGALRKDVEPIDMLVLTVAVQSAVEFSAAMHPELYRRIIGIILDGLRPKRSAPTPLPVAAMTDDQLHAPRRR